MIFAVVEDGRAIVFESIEHVRRHCDPEDVESGVFVFYAEDGTWLRPRLSTTTRARFSGHGEAPVWFELVPDARAPAEVDAHELAIGECTCVDPNPRFASTAAILAHIRSRRELRDQG